MEASDAEASVPQDKIPTPLLRQQVYNFDGTEVKVGVAQFNPRYSSLISEGQETVNPNKNAVVYLMGWPWTAKDQATWAFPAQLAESSNTACYSIDTADARGDKKSLALQGAGIGQFLIDDGVQEITFVAHSSGAVKATYAVRALREANQSNPDSKKAIKINGLVLVDPLGLDKRRTLGLLKDFIWDVASVGPKERKKGGIKAGEKGPLIEAVPQSQVVQEFKGNLKRISKSGKLGIPLLWSQRRALIAKDPVFSELGDTPIMVIVGGKDRVSNYKNYLPEKKVKERMQPVKSGDELRDWVISSKKWEHLPPEEQAKFTPKDLFIEKYIRAYRKQEEMFRLAKVRSQLAQEKHFNSQAPVKVIVTDRQADHNGIPAARGEQTSNVIAKISKFLNRLGKQN